MLDFIFNRSAKNEERVLPFFIEGGVDPLTESWITTQVCKVEGWKNRKKRAYYGAHLNSSNKWDIELYIYSAKENDIKSSYAGRADTLRDAIIKLMELESNARGLGAPIPGLGGNYRRIAHDSSLVYFDEKGNLVSAAKGVQATRDSLLTRKKIDDIYRKPEKAEEQAVPDIASWEDFYREVVKKAPLSIRKTPLTREIEELTANFKKKAQSGGFSSMAKFSELLPSVKAYPVSDLPDNNLAYHYNVMVLTTLMRAGGEAFSNFSTEKETLKFLSKLGSAIDGFAQEGLGLTPEQGKQIASIIMSGPDPNADKPLPLEAFIERIALAQAPKAQTHQIPNP